MMFSKVLVANRGVIACRIIRTLRALGVQPVAVYSEADRHSNHVKQAGEAVCIGPPPAAQSYLKVETIVDAARSTGAEAIHPGYGFLSEKAEFAEACEKAGIAFIGPTPEQMRAFGLKHVSRGLAAANGVPLLPGTELLPSLDSAIESAGAIGYPVMLKSTAGGGGIGMRLCRDAAALAEAYQAVERVSQASFGDSGMFLEKAVERARHIEVQIFGDGAGDVIALGERDCSVQRRNQKVIEETPAPGLSAGTRSRLHDAALKLARAVNYRSAGTVEFLYDDAAEDFYFLEVNTRLQVEHGVTEEIFGVDLVAWMVRLAAGELPAFAALPLSPRGHAIQARIYAEDPVRGFAPCAGLLTRVQLPRSARVETAVDTGSEITPYYDPMAAKIIVHAATRSEALAKLGRALDHSRFDGVETNLSYLRAICADPVFAGGGVTTSYLSQFAFASNALDVLEPGTQTTVQDYPGRLGYWHVGVPPSGPMDSLAFRFANRIVGNEPAAAALEIAMTGPTLRFRSAGILALTGADFRADLDGLPVPRWKAVAYNSGSTLTIGAAQSTGCRAYLAIQGGFDMPAYLGSKSTFILGKFGGHGGRVLRAADVLHIARRATPTLAAAAAAAIPEYTADWTIGVLYGPHGAPDFFTPGDIGAFFSTSWQVHYNSDRTGVRLIGPKPQWARKDGGEAGLHPSNIHDNAYAVGAIDFTGDMPVILGPDGPSLGGFVCPATVVQAELWKLGQLKPGDQVRFCPVASEEALRMERELELAIETLATPLPELPAQPTREPAILRASPARLCRAAGDKNLLIEYGPNLLDLNLRFRAHALEQSLRAAALPGIVDMTPGIRSLQVHYDSRVLSRDALLDAIDACDAPPDQSAGMSVPARIVHLPLSWDDPATQLAIRKYMQSVRPDAPWCPSNIEFIRRINGLDSIGDVHRILFEASYLVMGLGDVYLGAPVATPVDPRHRLVTTKYNPARTWTPENAVGIGGAYLCVYGMEGPGGYQFVGRTIQMWNTWRSTRDFAPETPWLLRFFDQIRFYPVSAAELMELREDFPHGKFSLRMEEWTFSLREYNASLELIATPAAEFKRKQQAAFEAERERWAAAGQAEFFDPPPQAVASGISEEIPEGCRAVRAPVTANVWSVGVEPGQRVQAGDRLLVLEAMKMEVAVSAPASGVVETLRCSPGGIVQGGQNLLDLRVTT